jgi:hypothetical protein
VAARVGNLAACHVLGQPSRASDFELRDGGRLLQRDTRALTAPSCTWKKKTDSDAEASEPGIFAELVSISSTRSAGVSDSAYFIESIELRPTFDLFLGARGP